MGGCSGFPGETGCEGQHGHCCVSEAGVTAAFVNFGCPRNYQVSFMSVLSTRGLQPAVSASLGTGVEMQILQLHLIPTEPETLGVGTSNFSFNKPRG